MIPAASELVCQLSFDSSPLAYCTLVPVLAISLTFNPADISIPNEGTVINSSPKKYGLDLMGELVGADVVGLGVGEDVVGEGVVTSSDSSQLDMSMIGLGVGGGVGAMTFQLDTSRANGLAVGSFVGALVGEADGEEVVGVIVVGLEVVGA